MLEQIVGDIGDEYDVDEDEGIRKEGERTFTVPALTRIDEFNAVFGTRFSDEEFDTIGGLVLHELGRLPRRGEAIEIGGLELKVAALRPAPHREPARHDAARHRAAAGRRRLTGCAPSSNSRRRRGRVLAAAARRTARRSRLRRSAAWPLAILVPACLFLLWQGAPPREAAWRGFLFTAGTFAAGTYWLYHSIHLVGQAPIWLALFLMLGMVAIMGAYTPLLG